ncbi:hypothetical protein [aff. Roholtiella sp. LEGE 12411]|uniref:hypothetical protein n=1 Tax=aff. Roholtiella sp. LEGE 12411 TaxID=1828822 RepID=UPI00187E49A6|nr:hypothetical protein [aff. Roholtiella sp. LEGE 12411]MBE9036440.1 hypothetical protein [aff. Roholtiella sp. LEGE 12411]
MSYESFLDAVRGAIAKQPNWQIEETAHITMFQDTKAAMIQDLEQNQDKIANHPILQGLVLKRTPDSAKTVLFVNTFYWTGSLGHKL